MIISYIIYDYSDLYNKYNECYKNFLNHITRITNYCRKYLYINK